jgi:site-specific recombinase XerD
MHKCLEQFLHHLALKKGVAASTQNQALTALFSLQQRLEQANGKIAQRAAREATEAVANGAEARGSRATLTGDEGPPQSHGVRD